MTDFLAEHLAEVEAASARIRPHVRWTPALETDLDPKLVLKPECLQRTGSFKVRGAFNAILRLRERKPNSRGVVAVSSGNHAQAVALAARMAGLPAVVLIPADSNPAKIAATRALGAEVITKGITGENREAMLAQTAEKRGLDIIHPFDDWDIVHGQGTAAYELLHDRPEVGAIVAPIGGGGLISGSAIAAKGHNPSIRIVGVEPEVAADAAASLRTKQRQALPAPPKTIADGVRPLSIGQRSFEVLVERGLLEDVVTVSEEEIEAAVLVAWERLKLALEPTGALPLAAYLAGKLDGLGSGPVGLILSGGNFDRALVARILNSAE